MRRKFTVVIEKDADRGYVGSVAELPGCLTQGDTLDELRVNVREAIEIYLEDEDLPEQLPEFVGVEHVEVSV